MSCLSRASAAREGRGIIHSDKGTIPPKHFRIRLVMKAPSIHYVDTCGCWEVTFGGKVRRHQQEWQCRVWYHMALAVYLGTHHLM
jgi:hypothetical protein